MSVEDELLMDSSKKMEDKLSINQTLFAQITDVIDRIILYIYQVHISIHYI